MDRCPADNERIRRAFERVKREFHIPHGGCAVSWWEDILKLEKKIDRRTPAFADAAFVLGMYSTSMQPDLRHQGYAHHDETKRVVSASPETPTRLRQSALVFPAACTTGNPAAETFATRSVVFRPPGNAITKSGRLSANMKSFLRFSALLPRHSQLGG